MSDYYAVVKIQQGRIRAAMKAQGIASVSELATKAGIGRGNIDRLLNFKGSPKDWSGVWRPSVIAICKALVREPIDIFPEHLDHEIASNTIESFVTERQLSGRDEAKQLSPHEECAETDRSNVLARVLRETLNTREAFVIGSMFFDGMNLAETAREAGCTRSRVDQIRMKALRKLRHPLRGPALREML